MKERHGADKHIHDLWYGALQIVAGIALLCAVVGFALGKWVF